jgi:hypothetical protein
MALGPVRVTAGVVNDGDSRGEGGNNVRATVLRTGRWRIIVAALISGLLLAGCGSSATSSPSSSASPSAPATAASPAPTSTSAVCRAATDLRDSVAALAHVKPGTGTVGELRSDLADVQAKLTALKTELHDTFTAQTNAVQSALNTLKTAISNLSAHPSTSTVKGVATAVGGVTTAVGNLLTSLAPQCGSASVSPSA